MDIPIDRYGMNLETIERAADRIKPWVHVTPVLTCGTLDEMAGRQLVFKAEVFQKGGAFKIRGASNAVLSLSEEEAKCGVVTHSSGNHAAAVALASKLRGVPAHIVMPTATPQCKVDATRGYGGQVHFCDPTLAARESTCAQVQAKTGGVFVHPYNNPHVIAGQGTMGLEFMQQVGCDLDAIIVPVSGGGMLSGVTLACKGLKPGIKVIAAEPIGVNGVADTARCKANGELRPYDKTQTVADGLQAQLGSLTFPIVRDLVEDVITVTEEEIVAAMRLCFERMKVVVEPSGAVGLAAALTPAFRNDERWRGCRRVGIILCGGNVDLAAKGVWDMCMWQAAAPTAAAPGATPQQQQHLQPLQQVDGVAGQVVEEDAEVAGQAH